MSSTLKMEPSSRGKESLPTGLKWILQKKFGGVINNERMTLEDINYVKALIDAEIDGAKVLLEYLERHEEIILDEEF